MEDVVDVNVLFINLQNHYEENKSDLELDCPQLNGKSNLQTVSTLSLNKVRASSSFEFQFSNSKNGVLIETGHGRKSDKNLSTSL